MTPLDVLRQGYRWGVRKMLSRWVRVTIKPAEAAVDIAARPHPVCYVLETKSQTDLAVLANACRQLRLPSPDRRVAWGSGRAGTGHLDLQRRLPRDLERLMEAAAANPHPRG